MGLSPCLKFVIGRALTILSWDNPVTAFFRKSKKLRHSLGRPSRSDFVHFQSCGEIESMHEFEFEGENMMEWINILGAVFIAVIMVPNIIFTLKCKDGFENKWNNKGVEVVEQIGRFGCFGFMVVNIPGTWFGWWCEEAFAIYLIANVVLIILYCVIWIICFRNNTIFKALTLSIIPSVIFIFSGIMSRSVLLIVASLLFAPAHILISYKNAKY